MEQELATVLQAIAKKLVILTAQVKALEDERNQKQSETSSVRAELSKLATMLASTEGVSL